MMNCIVSLLLMSFANMANITIIIKAATDFGKINYEKQIAAEKKYFAAYNNLIDEIEKRNIISCSENGIINTEKEIELHKQLSEVSHENVDYKSIVYKNYELIIKIITEKHKEIAKIFYEMIFYDLLLSQFFNMPTNDAPNLKVHFRYNTKRDIYWKLNKDLISNLAVLGNLLGTRMVTILARPLIITSNPNTLNNQKYFWKINEIYKELGEKIKEFRGFKLNSNDQSMQYPHGFNNYLNEYVNALKIERIYHGCIKDISFVFDYIILYKDFLQLIRNTFNFAIEKCRKKENNTEEALQLPSIHLLIQLCARIRVLRFLIDYMTQICENVNGCSEICETVAFIENVKKKCCNEVKEICETLISTMDIKYFEEFLIEEVFSLRNQIKDMNNIITGISSNLSDSFILLKIADCDYFSAEKSHN